MKRIVRRGFNLVELLIVIAIIGILLQLTLPAVQSSRESARMTDCKNNLRQIALAFQGHEGAHGHFPTSGWGWRWVGHPARGYSTKQPGGWAYNILPFIEQQVVRDLGSGETDGSDEQREAFLTANATSIPLLNCPSRRSSTTFPYLDKPGAVLFPLRCQEGHEELTPCRVCKIDFAANAGNSNHWPTNKGKGPTSLDEGAGDWEAEWVFGDTSEPAVLTGISYQRSQIRLAQITDGTSKTYCVGEKYVPAEFYETGEWMADNGSIFGGHDYDNNRWSGTDDEGKVFPPPVCDSSSGGGRVVFGSAHPNGFHMSFCDGSVDLVAYDVDATAHRLNGGRNDNEMDGK